MTQQAYYKTGETTFQHAHIGRYESSLEDGTLRLYYHEVGRPTGFSTKMTEEETVQLLEWLESHSDDIHRAAHAHSRDHLS